MLRIFTVYVFCLFFCNPLYAQALVSEQCRKAAQNDIIGLWKMNYQMANPRLASKSLFFADFQIFEFKPDNSVKIISSMNEIPLKQIKVQLKDMAKPVNYLFVEQGRMEINRSEKITDTILVTVITQDMKAAVRLNAPILKKGDLILSYLDANKQMYMQRFLRKLSLSEPKNKQNMNIIK